MASFEKGWPTWKQHEGEKFTHYGWDPGGATKFGITLRYMQQALAARELSLDLLDRDHDGDVDEQDVMLLTEPAAMEVFRLWWERQGYASIVDQMIATKVMDMSINMGPGRAHQYLQRALNTCGYKLAVDGRIGPRTLNAANDAEPRELLLELCHEQTEHYRRWCDAKPDREGARAGLHNRGAWPFAKDSYLPARAV
jgi:lysozyme family protein